MVVRAKRADEDAAQREHWLYDGSGGRSEIARYLDPLAYWHRVLFTIDLL